MGVERGAFALDVELEAAAGQTLAVVGPNGAGKSTLIEALAGLVPLARGRVELDGRVLEDAARGVRVAPQERGLGVALQGLWLFPALSALDNVAFGLVARGVARREAGARALGWLERLDAAALADRMPGQLSGGEAQRVALARALAPEPRLVLLDEPLAWLDAERRPRLRARLGEALAALAGVRVVVTHDPLEARLLGDRLLVIEGGRSLQHGSADDLQRRPASAYVATLLGANLIAGVLRNADGRQLLDCDGGALVVPEGELASGTPVVACVSPRAIVLAAARAESSARNTLEGRVESLDRVDHRVRVRLSTRPPLVAEVTEEAAADLALAVGKPVWASIKATEIDLYSR
jgi:molybdate transport system ATP-binding protein